MQLVKTHINGSDLINLNEKIDKVLPLNKFDDYLYWSSDGIDADKVYRVQKFVQRVVEETGVNIHSQIISHYNLSNKIYPYRMQLIKIDKIYIDTNIVIKDQICQTITPLTNDNVTYIFENDKGYVNIPEKEIGNYAIASYWTEHRDPGYKNWFIGKYLKYYG